MANRSAWLILVVVVFVTVIAMAAYYNRASGPEPAAIAPPPLQATPPANAPLQPKP